MEFRYYFKSKYDLYKIKSDDEACPGDNGAQYLPEGYVALENGCEDKNGAKYWKPSGENVTTAYNNTIVYGVYNNDLTYIACTFDYDYLEYIKNLDTEVAYYTWDVEQPATYHPDLKWYPLKYALYYIKSCNQYLVKFYDYKKL